MKSTALIVTCLLAAPGVAVANTLKGEDVPPREERKVDKPKYTGCGCMFPEWKLFKTKRGWDKTWTSSGQPGGGVRVACNKFPKKKVPAAIEELAKQQFKVTQGWTLGLDQEGTKTVDGETYKWVSVGLCSKKYEFVFTNCNEADSNVVCEYGGSRTAAYLNAILHYERRAEQRKKQGKTEICEALLEAAKKDYEMWERDVAPPGNSSWTKGLKYKLMDPKTKYADGPVLSEQETLDMIRAKGKAAIKRLDDGWCSS